ncbi:MAG: AMP-binding protein [Bacilli bacterium]|uniref:AMP-binding protein n=1 Tax=Carnobacterium maltaromaticum TaxID=2751 RepID=A0AAW9K241_CARML|nr:AMP-binding protein [Carnobacterium maltaromaticum]MDZ5757487.1 AMP-binding protein [Carnobacterium maltaromaticum]
MDLYNYIFKNQSHNKVAIIYQGKKVTYGKLIKKISEQSERISKLEENIFFILESNPLNTLVYLFAVLKSKKKVVLINPLLAEKIDISELGYSKSILIKEEKLIPIKMNSQNENNFENINLLTSGSTGTPKICPIPDSVIRNKVKIVSNDFFEDYQEINEILIFPVCSVTALMIQIFPTLLRNGTVLIVENLNTIPNLIEKYKINFIGLTPTLFELLYRKNKKIFNTVDNIFLGGEPISFNATKQVAQSLRNSSVIVGYGLTEAAGAVSYGNIIDLPNNSVGKIMTGTRVRVKKLNNNQMHGEIQVNNVIQNIWIDTGDIGYIEKDYLFVIDRKKNIVIVSGKKIYPNLVRDKVMEIQNIDDVLVYGINSETTGEAIAIDIITDVDYITLTKYLKQKLTLQEFPKKINYVTSLNILKSLKKEIKNETIK